MPRDNLTDRQFALENDDYPEPHMRPNFLGRVPRQTRPMVYGGDMDSLLSSGSVEGPYKRERPVRRNALQRAIAAVVAIFTWKAAR